MKKQLRLFNGNNLFKYGFQPRSRGQAALNHIQPSRVNECLGPEGLRELSYGRKPSSVEWSQPRYDARFTERIETYAQAATDSLLVYGRHEQRIS